MACSAGKVALSIAWIIGLVGAAAVLMVVFRYGYLNGPWHRACAWAKSNVAQLSGALLLRASSFSITRLLPSTRSCSRSTAWPFSAYVSAMSAMTLDLTMLVPELEMPRDYSKHSALVAWTGAPVLRTGSR